MSRVAIAADEEFVDVDEGWPLLRDALGRLDVEATVAIWDEPAVQWGRFDLVLVCYAWGYVARRERFLAWAQRAAAETVVVNPVGALTWNSDKVYLGDLTADGSGSSPLRSSR
ncbi:MAG: hypothetical protein ACRDZQ_15645, partial [Acidimicrobiales bacterium]